MTVAIRAWLRALSALAVIASICLCFGQAHAASGISQTISFEGKVVNASGVNIADGTYNMEFKIYTAATSCTPSTGAGCTLGWTEDWLVSGGHGVSLTSGTFAVNLDSVAANNFSGIDFSTNPLYLSIQIGNTSSCTITTTFQANCGGDGEMKPYLLFTSSPYAEYAGNSNQLGGLTASQFAQLAATQTFTGTNTFQQTTNATSVKILQNSNASPTADVFDVQGANGTTNFIQVTSTAANQGAITIASQGSSNALTLQGAGGVSLNTPAVSAAATNSTNITIATGNSTTSGNTGTITINTGNATSGTSGNITIDNGTSTTGTPTISIGTANARSLSLGNSTAATAVSINSGSTGGITLTSNNGTLTLNSGTGALNLNGGTVVGNATTQNLFNAVATTLNIGGAVGSGGIVLAGGSGSTGCTLDGSTGNLACTGNITGGATGTQGYWARTGTTLQPATSGDTITTSGNISTTGTGTITAGGTLTVGSSTYLPNNNNSSTNKLYLAGTDANHYIYSTGTGGNQMYLGEYQGYYNFYDTNAAKSEITFIGGQATYKNNTNSTTSFQVQPASSTTNVLDVDTSNSRVGINTNSPAYALDVAGDINTSGAYRINGASINTGGTLTDVAYLDQTQTFTGYNLFSRSGGGVPLQIQGDTTTNSWNSASFYSVDTHAGGRTFAFGSRQGYFSISDETATVQRVTIDGNGDLSLNGGALNGLTVNGGGISNSSVGTPTNSAFSQTGTTGLANGTYCYRVTATTLVGETTPSAETCYTVTGGPANVVVNWGRAPGAVTGYKIYGRTSGAEQLLATINSQITLTWTDTGASTPSGAMPTVNTSSNSTLVGNTTLKPATDNTTAFQVQNAAGNSIFAIDTSNKQINLNNLGATGGSMSFGGGGSIGSMINFNGNGAYLVNNGGSNELLQMNAAGADIFNVANTEIGRITSTGLGLGTTSPAIKLQVSNGGNPSTPSHDGGTMISVNNSSSAGNYAAMDILAGSSGMASLYLGSGATENLGSVRYNNSTNSLILGTSGATRLTIDTSGNGTLTGTLTVQSTSNSVFGNGTTGGIQIGDSTITKTAGSIFQINSGINTNTGFQYNGAASIGNYLRGNGTYFVSSAIQPADIPACSGTCNYINNGTSQQSSANFNISGSGTLGGSLTAASTVQGTQLISTVATGTAPLQVASTTVVPNLNVTYLNGYAENQIAENLRSNVNLTGGGTVTYDSSSNLSWTSRFIVIANGNGSDFSTNGYFDITQPGSGTIITGVGGAANITVSASGIGMPSWTALYYILPIGSSNGTVNANFRVATYTGSPLQVPSNWVLLAIKNGDNSVLRLGTGITLRLGQTTTQGAVDNPTFNTSVTVGVSGTTNGQLTLASSHASGSFVLQASTAQANATTITLPTDTNSTDTFCLSTLSNCSAVGAASGDLTGTYPSPTIAKLQGSTLTITSATSGQVLNYNGSAWVNTGSPTLSGNLTVQGTGTALSLTGAATTAIGITNTGVTTDLSLHNGDTISDTAAGTLTLGASTTNLTFANATGATISGSTSANGKLTLQGTTNGTRTTSYLLLQPSGGNVGIGNSSPQTTLDVGTGAISASQNGARTYNDLYSYSTTTSTMTGDFELVLPSNPTTNTFLTYHISGYDYSSHAAWQVIAGGQDSNNTWNNVSAQISGNAPFTSVRLAYDSSLSRPVILLGTTATTWSYPSISVDSLVAGYSNVSAWGSGYTSAFLTSEANITSIVTPSAQQTFLQGGNNFGANAVLGTTGAGQTLAFETGGTQQLILDASGNLQFQQASSLTTNGATNLTIDTGGAATLSIGANAATINVGGGSSNEAINIGNSSANDTVAVNNTSSGTNSFQVGNTSNGSIIKDYVGSSGETIKSVTGSNTAYQIQDASGNNLLVANTQTLAAFSSSITLTAGSNQGGSLSGSASTTYYYKVTAVTTDGETLPSSEYSINGASFTPVSVPGAPTLLSGGGTGVLGIGTYKYEITFVTTNGQTSGGTEASYSDTKGEHILMNNIPVGPSGTTAREIYRTVVGGASGTEKLVTTIADNTTTSYTDSTPDASLGATIPSTNTATTNTNNASISFTAPSYPSTTIAGYRVYRGTSSGGENTYQYFTTTSITDTGAAGTSGTVPTGTTNLTTSLGVGPGMQVPAANFEVQGNSLFGAAADNVMAFQVQNASNSTILDVDTYNGRVGIGTTSPTQALSVVGSESLSGNLLAAGYVEAGNGDAVLFSGTTAVNGASGAGGASFYGRPRIGDWGNWLELGEPSNGANGSEVLQVTGTGVYTGNSAGLGGALTVQNTLDDGSGNVKFTGGVIDFSTAGSPYLCMHVASGNCTGGVTAGVFYAGNNELELYNNLASTGGAGIIISGTGGVNTYLGGASATWAVCYGNPETYDTKVDGAGMHMLEDCSGTPVADYAEKYPVASNVAYGDIVSTGSNMVTTYGTGSDGNVNWGDPIGQVTQMVKSTAPYQTNTIGIVDDNGGNFSSTGYNIKQSDNPMSVALNGRVPVNVSPSSAPIQPGDWITTSGDAGKAMKATQAGFVIGKALAAWTPGSGQTQVMVFVQAEYWPGPDMSSYVQNGGNASLSGLTVSGTADFADLNASGATTLNDLTVTTAHVTGNLSVDGNLTVQGLATVVDLQVNGHIITGGGQPVPQAQSSTGSGGTVTVSGTDTAGTITVTTGSNPAAGDLANIVFSKGYTGTPRILLTGQDGTSAASFMYPANKSTTGFELHMDGPPKANTTYNFDYFIAQ